MILLLLKTVRASKQKKMTLNMFIYIYNQMKDKAQNLKSNEKPQKITSFH